VAQRAFNLFRWNGKRLRGSVQQQPHALAAGAKLSHAIQQTLRVPNRRDVRIGDEKQLIGGVHRRNRARIDLAAAVDDDVVVLPRQQPQQLFDRAAVGGARTVEMIRAGQNLQAGFVLHHQLAQKLAIEPMQVVDRIDDAEALADAEKQRHFAETGLQVDDHRGPLAQARQLHAAVHRQRGRAGAALGAEEHQRGRGGRAPCAVSGAPRCGGSRCGTLRRRAAR
jgi:hypothetical protein